MSNRKKELKQLIDKYLSFKESGRLELSSEETIRTWINQFLAIFDWDVMDASQVLQEKPLSKEEKLKLKEIDSTSTRPDYTFKVGREKITFLDAKGLDVDIKNSSSSAFQIKSYGWSISAPFAFLTNFEEFAIYDCSYTPSLSQKATDGRIYLHIDEYLDNFELLQKHLLRENMIGQIFNRDTQSEKSIDLLFAQQLSEFRYSLANEILRQNSHLIGKNIELLSYVTQVIINRIIFIRICEARKIEKSGLLLFFKESGFWSTFKESSYGEFYEHYDGPLFDRVDILQELKIDDTVFDELLELLYYPSPYRFDVIPTKLLSDIYEIFLSKKLIIKDGKIYQELKPEYIKSKGAVTTPQYLVEDLIRRTIDIKCIAIDDIFKIKSLDFACGSGIFLIELFNHLQELLISAYKDNKEEKFSHLFFEKGDEIALSVQGKRELIAHTIYGIDIDPEAVEVARMSLSLKIVDEVDYEEDYQELGLFGHKILNSVGDNIYCGNTLIQGDIVKKYPSILENEEQLLKTNPFTFDKKFDFIVGNPPYVEVKHYNERYPFMHQYIKEQYETTSNGKVDLSVAFIERGTSLLTDNGKMGIIVQNRFFKTQYGKSIRYFITKNQLLSQIVNFESNALFRKRITYISFLIFDKTKPQNILVTKVKEDDRLWEIDSLETNFIPSSALTKNPWNFKEPKVLALYSKLLNEFGSFGEFAKVRVGIQALWDRAYHIEVTQVNDDGTLTGNSKLEKNITIEVEACRPLMVNKKFYPFCEDITDTYVIFPYETDTDKNTPILFDDFAKRFPLASSYLLRHKATILNEVQINQKFQESGWHLYTRENNHKATYPKVMLPMTALDTFANVTQNPLNYCDNANMFFIDIPDKSIKNLNAVASIVNSTIFSVLARSIALAQQNGYFKFNKQFIEPIAFPKDNFINNQQLILELSDIAQSIREKQEQYKKSTPRQKSVIKTLLNHLWESLDEKVFDLYELDEDERVFFKEHGRSIDRVEILDA